MSGCFDVEVIRHVFRRSNLCRVSQVWALTFETKITAEWLLSSVLPFLNGPPSAIAET